MKGLYSFIVVACACLLSPALPASAVQQPEQQLHVAKVHVTKSERRLDLIGDQGQILRSYKIALGQSPAGNKTERGDGKTPEGSYYIDARNPRSDYHLSLRISYPDKSDVRRAQKLGTDPGGDIFIHGLPNGKSWMYWKYNNKKDWTQGCIAVENDAIEEIYTLVQDGTPILIKP